VLAHFKCIIGFEGGFLHNFLSRPRWHLALLCIMTRLQCATDPPFRNQMADEHPRQGPELVNSPGATDARKCGRGDGDGEAGAKRACARACVVATAVVRAKVGAGAR
jgi:hypothetical protein